MNIAAIYEPSASEIEEVVRHNSRTGILQTKIAAGIAVVIAVVAGVFGVWALTVVGALVAGFSLLIVRMTGTMHARTVARLSGRTTLKMNDEGYSYTLPEASGARTWAESRIADGSGHWTLSAASKVEVIVPKEVLRPKDRTAFEKFLAAAPRKRVRRT